MTLPRPRPTPPPPASDANTERLALTRRVEALERERRQLWLWVEHLERLAEAGLHARGLAHDLGNALTAIMANCELAQLQPGDTAELGRTVESNLKQAQRAAERLHTYVAYSRRDDTSLGPVGLGEVLDDALRFLAYPLRKAMVTVEPRLAVGPRVAMTHPRLLQVLSQALLTLVRHVGREGGRIEVRSHPEGDELVVDLRRVPPADEAASPAPAWGLGSTGFELHLVREILERAGGRLLGEPEDGLTGTVRLVLPVATEEGIPPSGPPHGRSDERRANHPAAWRAWSGGWTRSS